MIFFMAQLTAQTPRMPNTLPAIGQFFVAAMVIISISMLTTIISLKLYHTKGLSARNMPKWMREIFLVQLPRLMKLPPSAQISNFS